MASWDAYIDSVTATAPNDCDLACIIGLDGGAKWTTDAHAQSFKITPDEAVAIARVTKARDTNTWQMGGIIADGIKYQYLRENDDGAFLGKKKDHGAITIQASKSAIVIGHTKEGGQQGNTNKGVDAVAKYLDSLNM